MVTIAKSLPPTFDLTTRIRSPFSAIRSSDYHTDTRFFKRAGLWRDPILPIYYDDFGTLKIALQNDEVAILSNGVVSCIPQHSNNSGSIYKPYPALVPAGEYKYESEDVEDTSKWVEFFPDMSHHEEIIDAICNHLGIIDRVTSQGAVDLNTHFAVERADASGLTHHVSKSICGRHLLIVIPVHGANQHIIVSDDLAVFLTNENGSPDFSVRCIMHTGSTNFK